MNIAAWRPCRGVLEAHRKELIEPTTARYHGRTNKLLGDDGLGIRLQAIGVDAQRRQDFAI